MIVTLPKPGDEGYDDAQRVIRKAPRPRSGDGQIVVSLAYHAPIAHILGKPCVYFNPRVKWHRYPLVHERNVVGILVHESVHCAMQRLFDNYDKYTQGGFDKMFPMLGDL